ncbi:hypothetical protein R6Q57_005264 [Mikania cordata]
MSNLTNICSDKSNGSSFASINILSNISDMATSGDVVCVGPWGGPGGGPWTFRTNGGKINSIIITSNISTVNSLEFCYTDNSGNTHHAGPFGTPQFPDHHAKVFKFVDDEDLIEISGTFGMWANMEVITSLSFKTNKKVYGPVGMELGTPFYLPIKGVFEGFFGNSGDVIDAFGAILRP